MYEGRQQSREFVTKIKKKGLRFINVTNHDLTLCYYKNTNLAGLHCTVFFCVFCQPYFLTRNLKKPKPWRTTFSFKTVLSQN